MKEVQHYQELLKQLDREQLEDMIEDIFILLFHRRVGDGEYCKGWNDSREAIIEVCKLEKFRYNGK